MLGTFFVLIQLLKLYLILLDVRSSCKKRFNLQPEPNMFLCKTPALKVSSSNLKLYDFTGCIYVLETLRCNSELKQCRQNVSLTGKIWYVQHEFEFVNTKLILYHFNVTSIFDLNNLLFLLCVFNVVKDVNLKKISTSLSIYDPHFRK